MHFCDAWPWQQCRTKVADLYRKTGRPEDAARIDAEAQRYLAEADGDYPLRARPGYRASMGR